MSNADQQDLAPIIQAVIDAPALQPYYHPERSGRTPLVVVTPDGQDLNLRKFDQPVTVLHQPPGGGAYLEFTEIRRNGNRCTVDIRYPVEGIRGRFELARDSQGRWAVQRHELVET